MERRPDDGRGAPFRAFVFMVLMAGLAVMAGIRTAPDRLRDAITAGGHAGRDHLAKKQGLLKIALIKDGVMGKQGAMGTDGL